MLVEEVSKNAASLLAPIFQEEKGRNGRLSIQTDPRYYRDSEAILAQAGRFNALASNMIVKIAATAAGIPAIEEATYSGISINATVSFTVSQAVMVAEAVERGLRRREAEGKDISSMGPVCTIMVGRLDDWLKVRADKEGILTDPGYLEWAGVAVFKKAYQIFMERGYRARLLSAAFRNHFHWSELIGGRHRCLAAPRLAGAHQRQRHPRRASDRPPGGTGDNRRFDQAFPGLSPSVRRGRVGHAKTWTRSGRPFARYASSCGQRADLAALVRDAMTPDPELL